MLIAMDGHHIPVTPIMESSSTPAHFGASNDASREAPSSKLLHSSISRPKHRTFYSSPSAASDYFSDEGGNLPSSPELPSLRSSFNSHSLSGSQSLSMDDSIFSSPIRPAFPTITTTNANYNRSTSWSAQRTLLSRLESSRADIICASNLTGHQFREMNRAFDDIDGLFNAPDTQTREPAEVADSEGLFMDEEDSKRQELEQAAAMSEEERLDREHEMRTVVDRVLGAARRLQKQCLSLRDAHDVAQGAIIKATGRLHELESENAQLKSELAEAKLEMERLKEEAKVKPEADEDLLPEDLLPQDLLPQDFKFHNMVLEKLDRDLEELGKRRHSEMLSGQVTPARMSAVSPMAMSHREDEGELEEAKAGEEDYVNVGQDAQVSDEIIGNGVQPGNGSIRSKASTATLRAVSSNTNESLASVESPEPPRFRAWSQFWDGLASLSGFHDPDEME
jgi:hypothetical protein